MAIDISNKEEKQIALTGAEIESALLKANDIQSSASEIDNIVTNGATQADLDALVLESGNVTTEQATIIDRVGKTFSSSINLYDKTKTIKDKYVNNAGLLIDYVGRQTIKLSVKPSTTYSINKTLGYYCSFTSSGVKIIYSPNVVKFTTASNASYVYLSSTNAIMQSDLQIEEGAVSTPFVDYALLLPIKNIEDFEDEVAKVVVATDAPEPTLITASLTDETADFTGRRAIQDALDSITDATAKNRYQIIVDEGTYVAYGVAQFDNDDKSFVQGKAHVDVIGKDKDKCIIYGEIEDNLGTSIDYGSYSTVYWRREDSYLENVTVIIKNGKYPIHNDGATLDSTQYIKNCKVYHYGNYGDAAISPGWNPIGLGLLSGQEFYIEDTEVASVSLHNNTDFDNRALVKYKNCRITGRGDSKSSLFSSVVVLSLGSGTADKFILENCDIPNDIPIAIGAGNPSLNLENQPADRNNIELVIKDNYPRALTNSDVSGAGLMIKSSTFGTSSKVRFDKNSTAFPLIIANKNISPIELENSYCRTTLNGYEFFDGGQGLVGYAIGHLGITEDKAFASLGARLGDCSSTNKTLTVVVDSTTYNIVFNTNLTSATNAEVLAIINTTLLTNAVASEYSLGQDYYPEFKGVSIKTNADTVEILAGMGVVYTDFGSVRIAKNNDGYIDGIALDDCVIGGRTRIIRKGQINTTYRNQRFEIKETSPTNRTAGQKMGISPTHSGYFELNATPSLLRCASTNIVEII